jgi:hypothetical protein
METSEEDNPRALPDRIENDVHVQPKHTLATWNIRV